MMRKKMMSDLIRRLSDLRSQYSCFTENERGAYHTLSEAIEALQEQKTGKWTKETKHHMDDQQEFYYYEITCSVCGSRPEKAWHLTPFCPNCGAKMEGEEDDER